MSFLGVVVLIAAVVPLLTGGSYRRLADAPWRWGGLLALGLGLQLLLDTSVIPRSSWHSVGFGILVASYVLLVGFCAGNVLIRGMAVVLVGVALNGFIVTVDQGMPVHIPPDWQNPADRVSATVKHHPQESGDHLLGLTDIIILRKLDSVISFGDLIIAVGLIDAAYWASRNTRRSRAATHVRAHAPSAATPRRAEREPVSTPAPVREPVSADAGARTGSRSPSPGPTRPRRPVRAGTAGGRRAQPSPRSTRPRPSAPAEPIAAIEDALERLERS